jgi:DNA polymerase
VDAIFLIFSKYKDKCYNELGVTMIETKNILQINELHKDFDKLQKIYGAKELDSIYGAGCISNPDICFIFMNPTGKNIASSKLWLGIKAQWLGTKNIWKLFDSIGLLDNDIYRQIIKMKPDEWNYDFSTKLYENICQNKIYITNLGKCTQSDAKPLSNKVFKEYLYLLEKEIDILKPKIIITFGNQVSSILLEKSISVSTCRKKNYIKTINENKYKIYPVFYPVGQGMRNINIAINDIKDIKRENNIR